MTKISVSMFHDDAVFYRYRTALVRGTFMSFTLESNDEMRQLFKRLARKVKEFEPEYDNHTVFWFPTEEIAIGFDGYEVVIGKEVMEGYY